MEFPRDLTILWNIQGLSFVLSGISRDKVKKMKFPGVMGGGGEGEFKKAYPQPPVWIFSGIPWDCKQITFVMLNGFIR